MPLFLSFVVLVMIVPSPGKASGFTPDELRSYLARSFDENVSLNQAFIEASRLVHQLEYGLSTKPQDGQIRSRLEAATQNRDSLKTELTKQMISVIKLTKEEFIQLFNLISDDCIAGIAGDQVIVDQKMPDGGHHLVELPLESGLLKHTVRGDIDRYDLTKFHDPSEFTLIGFSTDKRIRPWDQSIDFSFKVLKRLGPDRYRLAPDGMAVQGFSSGTSFFWTTEQAVVLKCKHKPEIQF
jgi:hypothetical protein